MLSVHSAVRSARFMGEKPRVHPNGFIQLDLAHDGTRIATQRLHVWPDGNDIPKQSVGTTIHDHRFDMRSSVITGMLLQRCYSVNIDPHASQADYFTHEIYTAQYPQDRKESQLMPTGVKAYVIGGRIEQIITGRSYTQPKYSFHDTKWVGLTATLMEKTGEDLDYNPRVLVPLGKGPDNSFVRSEVDEGLLWEYIERALGPHE